MQIDDIIKEITPEIIALRHKLHSIPEIAGKEFKTCAEIRKFLSGVPHLETASPFLETDTVSMLYGRTPGKNVTLRADIDALALAEQSGAEYSSEHPGFAHSCGHDAHMAMLCGAAKVLSRLQDKLSGSVRFVFQPGEENVSMAKDLIAAGAINTPAPDYVAALHIVPKYPVGTLVIRKGTVSAASAHFIVKFKGLGGHGSRPDLARNPITALASAIVELQGAVQNRITPFESGVISVATVSGGTLPNIISEEASFSGTIRALTDDTAEKLIESLRDICQCVVKLHRVEVDVNISGRYPATVNDDNAVDMAAQVIENANIPLEWEPNSAMSSEDFAYFLHRAPGVYLRIGTGVDAPDLHNPRLDAPDEMLANGIKFLVNFALAGTVKE